MSSREEYGPCRNCGTLTDSGCCSPECARALDSIPFEVQISVTHTYTYHIEAPNAASAGDMALDLHNDTHENIGPGVTRTEPLIVNTVIAEED